MGINHWNIYVWFSGKKMKIDYCLQQTSVHFLDSNTSPAKIAARGLPNFLGPYALLKWYDLYFNISMSRTGRLLSDIFRFRIVVPSSSKYPQLERHRAQRTRFSSTMRCVYFTHYDYSRKSIANQKQLHTSVSNRRTPSCALRGGAWGFFDDKQD